MVRVGHLSRFSEMIVKIEALALENLGFENYMQVLEKCQEQAHYESSQKFLDKQAKLQGLRLPTDSDEDSPTVKKTNISATKA